MKTRIVILVVVLAAASAAYFLWPRESPQGANRLYGNVDIREVRLGFRVAGRLQDMHFEEGDAVTAGTVLARLDPKPLQDGMALAQARVAEAEARLALLHKGSRPQEIQQAQARVDEAKAALDNANRELKRQQELTASGLSSQRLLDSAIAVRDQAAARLEAVLEALALAVEGTRLEDIAAGEAALAAARVQLEQAKTRVDDTELLAPNDGIIFSRVREPGAILGVGTPVYSLSLTDTVYVRAYIDEAGLGSVVPGTAVTVRSDSSDKAYSGKIGFVSPRAEFTPKSVETPELRTDLVYRLRIVITDPDDALRQGMPVTIAMPGG